MKLRTKGANYIGATDRTRVRSLKTRLTSSIAALAAVATVLIGIGAGALAIDASSTKHVTTASAGLGMSCTTVIGGNMDERGPWGAGTWGGKLYPELKGRTFTINEVVGAPAWTNYTGIGPGPESDFFVKPYADVLNQNGLAGKALDDGTGKGSSDSTAGILPQTYKTNWGDIKDKLTGERNTGTCFWEQTFVTNVANGIGLGAANAIQTTVTWLATNAFNSSFICDPNTPAADGCIDLVRIIGGTPNTSDTGLIGSLTNSIYKPLVLIVVMVTALGVLYTGVVKRRFRDALGQAVWLAVSFIIGLAVLLNPSMLAKAPMVASNTVSGCVIGAFNGANCFSGAGFGTKTSDGVALTADKGVCVSDASGATADQLTGLAVNSMGCTIWKTFILQNYAKGAFGTNLDQLEVKNADTVAGKAVAKSGVDPNKFCYSLQTTGSANGYDGKWLESKSGGSKVCNLAVYNMLMQMKVTPAGQTTSNTPTQFDPAWYNLITTVASSDKMWPIWSNGGQQFAQGIVAVVSTILGGILISVVAITALMYYLTAVILMIFAPLFILVGMHPTRGKKIMLGWLETILASILKYLASAIFLLVSLALYSAVLGAADPMSALLFVGILSMVLWMYRKEIVETFSRVNLGGERMANVLDQKIPMMGASARQLGDKAAKMPSSIVGGALGGFAAGGISKMGQGAAIAAQNELRSAPGLVGRTAQATERQKRDNMTDFNREATRAGDTAKRSESTATALDRDADNSAKAAQAFSDNDLATARADQDKAVNGIGEAQSELRDANLDKQRLENVAADADLKLDTESTKAAVHTELEKAVAESGLADGTFGKDMSDFKKLMADVQALGLQAKLAGARGDTVNLVRLEKQRDDAKVQAGQIYNGATNTPEKLKDWKREESAYNAKLNNEKRLDPQFVNDDGTIQKFNENAVLDANKQAMNAGRDLDNADIRITMAENGVTRATEAAGEMRINTQVVQEKASSLDSEAEAARTRARTAEAAAAGNRATADKMFQQMQDLGPGKLPTGRDNRKAMDEAQEIGKGVSTAFKQADGLEATEASAPTLRERAAAAMRETASVSRTGMTLDERLPETNATRQAAEARNAAATQAQDSAKTARGEANNNIELTDRAVRAAVEQLRLAQSDSAMRAEYARGQDDVVRETRGQLEQLEKRMNAPEPGKEITPEMYENARQRLETKLSSSLGAIARDAAAKEAETRAQEALDKMRVEADEARRESREARRDVKDATRDAQSAAKDHEKAIKDNERVQAGIARSQSVLTADDAPMVKKPKTSEDFAINQSLDKLVDMANELAKAAPQTTEQAKEIAKYQELIKSTAKNARNSGAGTNAIARKIEEQIRNLVRLAPEAPAAPTTPTFNDTPPSTPPAPRPGGGIPTRPGGGLPGPQADNPSNGE